MSMRGARYLQIFVPCPLGWGSATNASVSLARYADLACGRCSKPNMASLTVTKIRNRSGGAYMKPQRRFAHVFKKAMKHSWKVWKLQNATSVTNLR